MVAYAGIRITPMGSKQKMYPLDLPGTGRLFDEQHVGIFRKLLVGGQKVYSANDGG
jgi:hypothetical protein